VPPPRFPASSTRSSAVTAGEADQGVGREAAEDVELLQEVEVGRAQRAERVAGVEERASMRSRVEPVA